MILVALTISGSSKQVSTEGLALESYWDAHITDVTSPQYGLPKNFGGYCQPSFGSITLTFDPFSEAWPPPMSIDAAMYYTDSTEAAKQLLFSGKGHLAGLDREGVTYDLYGPSYTYETPSATAFSDTLVNVVAWFCNAARLNLTLNSSAARSPSPAVSHTTTSEQLGIDLLSNICAFFGHLFYIRAGTLYLVDMLGYSGSRTLTEFDVFPASYSWNPPVSAIKGSGLAYETLSPYAYGSELSPDGPYHGTQSNVETAWSDILTLQHRARASISLPMAGTLPLPGERLLLTDESTPSALTATMYVRGLTYDFMSETVTCECDGGLA